MVHCWPKNLWFYYAVIDDKRLVDQIEDDLIAAFVPPLNRKFPATISELLRKVFS